MQLYKRKSNIDAQFDEILINKRDFWRTKDFDLQRMKNLLTCDKTALVEILKIKSKSHIWEIKEQQMTNTKVTNDEVLKNKWG